MPFVFSSKVFCKCKSGNAHDLRPGGSGFAFALVGDREDGRSSRPQPQGGFGFALPYHARELLTVTSKVKHEIFADFEIQSKPWSYPLGWISPKFIHLSPLTGSLVAWSS